MSLRLSVLQGIEQEWSAADPDYPEVADDDEFFGQLTLSFGIAKVRANRDWCDRSIERLQKRRKR